MKNIKDISIVENTWRFDDDVANIFDKHVKQSIPHYENLQNYLASIAEWYLKDNALIYDLGCSTGATAIKLSELSIDTNFTLIGYDDNKKMIDLAKKKVKKIKKKMVNIFFKKKIYLKLKNLKKLIYFIQFYCFHF